jgi:choline dehydrogenase-like flavoprotein
MWTFVNEAIAFPNMADLLGEPAANYAGLVADQLNATWTETVANKDLPANVARGLSAQYQIQQSQIDSEVGQVEMLLHLLGPNNAIGIQAALQHPWSRGTIFITSNNAFTNPAINPDYFSVGYDIDIMNNAMQFARRIAQASPMNDLAVAETQPGAASTGNTLDDYIRSNGVTTYHPIGTCSMLPRDSGGVVDTRLIVYGTGNIRVVDSSIIPLHMSAHTMGTTYGVAEKAAEIIKRKYYAVQEVATSSDEESATGSATSGKTTGTGAVAGASNFGANTGMSMAAKIGVGAGVGAGVLALLAALVCFPSKTLKGDQSLTNE